MRNLMYWKGELEINEILLTRVSCYHVVPSSWHNDEEQDEVFIHWYIDGEKQDGEPTWVGREQDDLLDKVEINVTERDLEADGLLTH